MRFIVRNHRNRAKLTLTAANTETLATSISLSLDGKRVVEISDRLCARYADSIAEYVKSGALIPTGPAASE